MKANELRLGNLVEYYITDNTDERKEWWEVTKIDVHDLESLSQTNDPDYRPIPLTEDWLLRAGFERNDPEDIESGLSLMIDRVLKIEYLELNDGEDERAQLCLVDDEYVCGQDIYYVHQLQNLYFALTGHELTFAENHNPCTSDDPDDRCENCNCWKSTRANCS